MRAALVLRSYPHQNFFLCWCEAISPNNELHAFSSFIYSHLLDGSYFRNLFFMLLIACNDAMFRKLLTQIRAINSTAYSNAFLLFFQRFFLTSVMFCWSILQLKMCAYKIFANFIMNQIAAGRNKEISRKIQSKWNKKRIKRNAAKCSDGCSPFIPHVHTNLIANESWTRLNDWIEKRNDRIEIYLDLNCDKYRDDI